MGHLPTHKTTVAENPQIGLHDGQPTVFEEIQQLIVFANANKMRGSYVFQSSDRAVAFKVGLTVVNAPFGFANFAADQFRLCGATWRTAMSASRCRRSDKEFEASTSMRFVDRYVGSDVASKMVEIAKGNLTEQSPQNLRFAVQDAGVMTSGSNDVVLALNLLHLLLDRKNTLAGIYKALPSGGLLISKTGLLKDGLWLLPLVIPLKRAIGKAPFVRSSSEESLIGLLENAGFEVTEKLVPRVFMVAQKPNFL